MTIIDLDLDNENEMMFKVQIEGTRPGQPLCRLMIEGSEMTHAINGDFLPNSEVAILIPPLKGILKEGTYDSYLEVLVDDRVFIPLEMQVKFEETVKVVAEAITNRKVKPTAKASLLSSNKKEIKSEMTEIKASKTHPAKIRRDAKLDELKKQNSKTNENIVSENDIMDLVRRLRNKTKN